MGLDSPGGNAIFINNKVGDAVS